VGRSIREVLRTGVIGFNLEDGTARPDMPVRPIDDAVARIRAARAAANAAGVPAVINARVDLYLKNVGDPASRFDETVRRGMAYLAAGADCIYPFGLADMDTIARLIKALEKRRSTSWRGPARRRSPSLSGSESPASRSPRARRSPSCR
jgi:2-methylisocitrate lyase-like PEP mutase family enzyme